MLERFTWFRQSAFQYKADGATIYIDPWGLTVDDPADVVFITHAHSDHFSPEDLDRVVTPDTRIFAPQDVAKAIKWAHDHAKDYGGDPDTLFVMGHSAGAQLAALVCTDESYLKADGLSLALVKGCMKEGELAVFTSPLGASVTDCAPPATFANAAPAVHCRAALHSAT